MKHNKKLIAVLAAILVVASTAMAFGAIPEPSQSYYVADYADVITDETEQYIIQKNADLEYYCDGAQIVVVTVDFLDGMDIEDYCYKLFNDWQIGGDSNNGILLLLTIGEENYWCMAGKGLEGDLTAGEIDELLWIYLEDGFAAEMYDFGVKETFDQLYNEIYDIYNIVPGASGSIDGAYGSYEDMEMTFWDWVLGIIVLFAPFVIMFFVIRAIVRAIRRRIRRGPAVRPVIVSTRPARRVYIPTTVHRPYRPVRKPASWSSGPFDYYPPVPPHRPPSNSYGGSYYDNRPISRPVSRPSGRPSSFGGSSSFGGGGFSSGGSRSGLGHGGGGSTRGGGAGRRGR